MATHYVTQDQNTKLQINNPNEDWVVNEGVTISRIDGVGVYIDPLATGASLTVYGTVANGGSQYGAIIMNADDSEVVVGDTGYVQSAKIGVDMVQERAILSNGGFIGGHDAAVLSENDDQVITNSGKLDGYLTGIKANHDNLIVTNTGKILGHGAAIISDTEYDETFTLNNYGLVKADGDNAITGGLGVETIVNKGTINGDIKLGGGNDHFDFSTGNVLGTVYGGSGHDSYIVNGQEDLIVELAEFGTDDVTARSDFKLGANIENLTLWGQGDFFGRGNALGNHIIGNDGDNLLRGMAGNDLLSGAMGKDQLVGGLGSDTFYFTYKDGTDTIMDFDATGADHDTIDLDGFADSFSEIVTMLHKKGDDVVLRVDADYAFVLKDVKLADLDATDFTW
jgi:Ca2+-binding RTX toxin-like protein